MFGGLKKVVPVIGIVFGAVSLFVAFVSAFLSAAPFTPAVYSVVITIPLSVLAIMASARRTGWLAIYWSACAALAFSTLQYSTPLGDWVLLLAYFFGFVLSVALLVNYRKSRHDKHDDEYKKTATT